MGLIEIDTETWLSFSGNRDDKLLVSCSMSKKSYVAYVSYVSSLRVS